MLRIELPREKKEWWPLVAVALAGVSGIFGIVAANSLVAGIVTALIVITAPLSVSEEYKTGGRYWIFFGSMALATLVLCCLRFGNGFFGLPKDIWALPLIASSVSFISHVVRTWLQKTPPSVHKEHEPECKCACFASS